MGRGAICLTSGNTSATRRSDRLISDALAIEAEVAINAGALGFMARALVQATLPHKRVAGNEFTRRNGAVHPQPACPLCCRPSLRDWCRASCLPG